MTDVEDNGWSQVHQCASDGYLMSLERLVENDGSVLELETNDNLKQTPILLAVREGREDIVQYLIRAGAKVEAVNTLNHGIVDIGVMKGHYSLLQNLSLLALPKLPVWKNLFKLLSSTSEEEVEAAGKCLDFMTGSNAESNLSSSWKSFLDNSGITAVVKLAKSTIPDNFKIHAFHALFNILDQQEVQEQFMSSDGASALIHLLKSSHTPVIKLCSEIIMKLSTHPQYSKILEQAVPSLLKVLQSVQEEEVCVPVLQSISNIAHSSEKLRSSVGKVPELISTISLRLQIASLPALVLALTNSVANISDGNSDNQCAFIKNNIKKGILKILSTQMRNKEIQASVAGAVYKLADSNEQTQKELSDEILLKSLMDMLKKTRVEALQEKTAMAVWALAGNSTTQKRKRARDIGVAMLIRFLLSNSENVNFIGSEGLGVLAQGPLNQQSVIGKANGILSLIDLLKSQHDHIVLSVIRTLRFLCLGVAHIPHRENQNYVSQCQGIKYLVALLVHASNELVQVESAYTLGCVSLGNKKILEEILKNGDFSYVRILKMLYSSQAIVQLLAGSALATFAYNNLTQQKEIDQQGGIRFNCFVPFLKSDDEYYRCNAAFQVVVLARIIPDEEQARASAVGIKLLIDLLEDSQSVHIQALAADYVASLSHTRAGVPSAMVAIDAVEILCELLCSSSEEVRGTAAIALSYLSHDHKGNRKILHICRKDPYLMKEIKRYAKSVAKSLNEGWQHCKKIGLPPIQNGRINMVSRPTSILTGLDENVHSFHNSSSSLEEDRTSIPSPQVMSRRNSLHNKPQSSRLSHRSNHSRMSLIEILEES
ncbi:ankyrin and armadillo repeat-containing protein-like isoform X2 [Physella acuta]|uniref:ankyrin and armadillo repeat-containing protein-like isoform X2 n=1 Tax=Physella acuta TaxID=109671 RepID=UPI0027DD59BD|nr:ankyrin and armadillo repeat-containing protein-like isoform X2 [Physella acuta]